MSAQIYSTIATLCATKKWQDVKSYLSTIHTDDQEIVSFIQTYYDIFEHKKNQIQTKDDSIRYVLDKYEQYMRWIFTNEVTTESCKEYLVTLYQEEFPNVHTWEELEKELQQFFETKGYYCLVGITPPYPDLYVWKTRKKERKQVEILEQVVEMNVYEMSDVLVAGWYGYFTLNKRGAAGWVSDDGAYYFAHHYDTDSEDFQVSLLKHEAQHFWDLKQNPNMPSYELEYRAKLIELIYYQTESRLLTFLEMLGDSKEEPHPYANKQILTRLSRKIFSKELETDPLAWKSHYKTVRKEAKELLKACNSNNI